MDIKKTLYIMCSAFALAALASCAKEQVRENAIPAGEKIQVAINGQIGEFIPADATKATAESVVRVTWGETGDKVYVYDGSDASIGTLDVVPADNNASCALLSGTITASSASSAPSKLTLVYVKGAANAPAIAGGKISIDLSSQDQTEVPFVLYATINYDKDKLTRSNEYVPFKFATSVMKVNCTGLPTGEENAKINITKAEIEGMSTSCELAVTGSGVTVAGANKGKITRSETSVFTQSDSRGSFKLALAADSENPTARKILVFQDNKVYGASFTTTKLGSGESYNTVYHLNEYVSDGSGDYTPAIKVTGVSLDKSKAGIEVGGTETLVATVTPTNATNKQVIWSSSDTAVATVDKDGVVTGVAAGSANITATTADGHLTAVCLVTVKPTTGVAIRTGNVGVAWVQLWRNGPKFAEYNVGAANNKAEDYGTYYAWSNNVSTVWGNNWRRPTKDEFAALLDEENCTHEWTTQNNVTGLLCKGIKGTVFESNKVFLPAGGYYDQWQRDNGRYGCYWTSTPNGSDAAWRLYFDLNNNFYTETNKSLTFGYSVRAVLNEN